MSYINIINRASYKIESIRESYFDILCIITLSCSLTIIFFNEYSKWDFPGGDYSHYAINGNNIELSWFIFNTSNYPLYVLYIKFFKVITGSAILAFQAQIFISILIAVILIYILLRTKISTSISFILSFIFLITCFGTLYGSGGNTQYLFSFIFICLLFILHQKKSIGYRLAGLLLTGIGIFFRPELMLVFYLYAFYLFFSIVAFKHPGKNLIILLLIILLFSIPNFFSRQSASKRANFAFSQHFAAAYVERNNIDINPWLHYSTIIEKEFGGKNISIPDALGANPTAFLKHVLYNFIKAIITIPKSFFMVSASVFYILTSLFLCLLFIKKRIHFSSKENIKHVLFEIMPYFIPLVLFFYSIVLYPFDRLLLSIVPLAYLAAGLVVQAVLPEQNNRFIILVIFTSLVFISIKEFSQAETTKPYRMKIEISKTINQNKFLSQLNPDKDYKLLSANPSARELCALLDRNNYIPVEIWAIYHKKDEYEHITMDKYIAMNKVDFIFMNKDLQKVFSNSEITSFKTKIIADTEIGKFMQVIR